MSSILNSQLFSNPSFLFIRSCSFFSDSVNNASGLAATSERDNFSIKDLNSSFSFVLLALSFFKVAYKQ